jgi:multiple sugar transport system ATP-binding protein
VTAVRFERITKTFPGGVTVLRDFDLEVKSGELLTLVGPSGCGKSTLLNLLAGYEQPTSGSVSIDGRVVDRLSPSDRGLAMVFQSYALYPHLDVRRNIAFPLEVARTPRAEIDARVTEVAERLGLDQLLGRRPKELSGGQRQRVALARALVRRSKLCLFDEPLSNLDAALRGQMRAEIKRLHGELGATFVYVTHDQAEAMTLSDRVVVLHGGAIEQSGSPREIYDEPRTLFVARFVGSPPINEIAPRLAFEAVPEHLQDADLAIRPEHVRVEEAPGNGLSQARIWVVEPLGPETWVTLDHAGTKIVGRAAPHFAARAGQDAYFALDRRHIHVFDRKTGRRRGRLEP